MIDARTEVVTQTRRHAHIAALLGIEHIVMCVNKMDLVSWDRERFEEIVDEVHEVVRRLGVPDVTVIPISALHGDNIALGSDRTPFYDGPTLLEYLEQVDIQADRDLWRLRVPIQWVGRPVDGGSRLYMGRIVAGMLEVGCSRSATKSWCLPPASRPRSLSSIRSMAARTRRCRRCRSRLDSPTRSTSAGGSAGRSWQSAGDRT